MSRTHCLPFRCASHLFGIGKLNRPLFFRSTPAFVSLCSPTSNNWKACSLHLPQLPRRANWLNLGPQRGRKYSKGQWVKQRRWRQTGSVLALNWKEHFWGPLGYAVTFALKQPHVHRHALTHWVVVWRQCGRTYASVSQNNRQMRGREAGRGWYRKI